MRRNSARIAFVLAGTLALCSTSWAQTIVASNTFDAGGEGWRSRINPGGGGTITFPLASWSGSGGNPDGRIFHVDEAGGHNFVAPAEYLGDQSDVVGRGSFSFDLFTDLIDTSGRNAGVTFYNGVSRLHKSEPITPADQNTWLQYDFDFDEATSWKYFDDAGVLTEPATLEQMCLVMSNVTEVYVTGETLVGPSETVSLDNIRLITRCACSEPCPGDVDGDGTVNGADLAILLASWGTDCNVAPLP